MALKYKDGKVKMIQTWMIENSPLLMKLFSTRRFVSVYGLGSDGLLYKFMTVDAKENIGMWVLWA